MKRKNIIIGIIVIVLIIVGLLLNNYNKKEAKDELKNYDLIVDNRSNQIVVDIKGEVKAPGIYYLNANSRVIDAIKVAGGLTAYADITNINLASKIEDGTIIFIHKKEITQTNKISINKATIDDLIKLPGIGEAKAKKIIEYRSKNGYFNSLEDLLKVEGINENLYKQIKEFICL